MAKASEAASRWWRAAGLVWEVIRRCVRGVYHDRAEQMAAALTYRTLFALIPITVLVLIIIRSLVGMQEISQRMEGWLLDFLGFSRLGYQQVEEAPSDAAPIAADDEAESAADGEGAGDPGANEGATEQPMGEGEPSTAPQQPEETAGDGM